MLAQSRSRSPSCTQESERIGRKRKDRELYIEGEIISLAVDFIISFGNQSNASIYTAELMAIKTAIDKVMIYKLRK